MLLAGIPLERVATLLGHQSVKITERHYAPRVHERQVQIESDVPTHGENGEKAQPVKNGHAEGTGASSSC
jgi:integrase/recombinase XerD